MSKNAISDSKKVIKVKGVVKECLPGTKFIVEINLGSENAEPHQITAYIAGKMRMHYIKLVPGNEVEVEMSPYDLDKGRITYRL